MVFWGVQTIGFFMAKLSNFFHVYILDQMNHGNSPHSLDINYDLLSDDIYEFIKFKNHLL